jgi:hypothetical protein
MMIERMVELTAHRCDAAYLTSVPKLSAYLVHGYRAGRTQVTAVRRLLGTTDATAHLLPVTGISDSNRSLTDTQGSR